jgi:diaminopimelate epimerase
VAEALEFYKMSGAGNDFIVADNRGGTWSVLDLPALARGLCRRGLSVGADGLVLVEGSNRARIRVRVFNSNGSEAELCGNGTRCAARFAFIRVIAGKHMTVETAAGVIEAEVLPDTEVRLRMPVRPSEPSPIELQVEGRAVRGYLVHAGVPHLVVFVSSAEGAPVASLGPLLRAHPDLGPSGTNVDFLELRGEGPHAIRTFERGVEAETLACGTGVTAAAWLLCRTFSRPPLQRFIVRSGRVLEVEVASGTGADPTVRLKGEARVIFRGTLTEESLQEALA